jgi:hypothetical protein
MEEFDLNLVIVGDCESEDNYLDIGLEGGAVIQRYLHSGKHRDGQVTVILRHLKFSYFSR